MRGCSRFVPKKILRPWRSLSAPPGRKKLNVRVPNESGIETAAWLSDGPLINEEVKPPSVTKKLTTLSSPTVFQRLSPLQLPEASVPITASPLMTATAGGGL